MPIRALQELPAGSDQLDALLARRVSSQPRCAVTRYLLGCRCLDGGRTGAAVRHFMLAYRMQPVLESAALLAFAGLDRALRPDACPLRVLLETWEEYRRPEFDRRRFERAVLDHYGAPPPAGLGELGRRVWRLPSVRLRARIAAVAGSRERPYDLLGGALAAAG
mgnify:CR=1 FL=1